MSPENAQASLESLLERNNISLHEYLSQSYDCLLISIFEVLAQEMNEEPNFKKEVKLRFLESPTPHIVAQKIVYEKTKCILSMEESKKICTYLQAALRKTSRREHYDESTRLELLEKQHYQCNICKRAITPNISELDHIIPWIYVGDELGIINLQMLCRDCNRRKSKNTAYNLKMFLISH